EVVNPNPATYTDAQITPGHVEPQFVPTVSFPDVSNGTDVDISVGFVDHTRLGVDNARIISAVQPDGIWSMGGSTPGVYAVDYDLTGSVDELTEPMDLGSLYGIGVDPYMRDIYAGAYAKRGSPYGPDGPGAIYRIDVDTAAR